jgi:hypothetical protein
MTGQVKEEILTRLGELGVTVKDGCITFQPRVLHPAEFSAAPHPFAYVAVTGAERTVDLPARSLAFTFCQAPVVYVLSTESSLTLQHATGATEVLPGNTLPAAASRELFHRTGRLASITVNVKESSL